MRSQLAGIRAMRSGGICGVIFLAATISAMAESASYQIMREGSRLYSRGDLVGAVALLQSGIAVDPDNAQLHFVLANTFFRKKEWVSSAAEYKTAARLRPKHSDTFLNLGFAEFNSGHLNEAIQAWMTAARLTPTDSLPCLALAIGFLASGREEEAVGWLASARRLDSRWEQRIAIDVRWTREMTTGLETLWTKRVRLKELP